MCRHIVWHLDRGRHEDGVTYALNKNKIHSAHLRHFKFIRKASGGGTDVYLGT
jgi:hypothetical protein